MSGRADERSDHRTPVRDTDNGFAIGRADAVPNDAFANVHSDDHPESLTDRIANLSVSDDPLPNR